MVEVVQRVGADNRVEGSEVGEVIVGQDPVREPDPRPSPSCSTRCTASASIAGEPSSPTIVVSGYALAKRTVMSAGPHARSSMRRGLKPAKVSPNRVTAA